MLGTSRDVAGALFCHFNVALTVYELWSCCCCHI